MNKATTMVRLSQEQVEAKKAFIREYIKASNAATASKVDANANVTQKNLATLSTELNKDVNIQVFRSLLHDKIKETYGAKVAFRYLDMLEEHELYCHDETTIFPYCASISMYPFITDGLKSLGGDVAAPKHLDSFAGSFINLMYLVSAQFAGAIATVEFLMYFDHFARKDYGDEYLLTEKGRNAVIRHLRQVCHSLNQPAVARGNQSVFWNISIFDKHYFESLFGDFVFPDGDKPKWETVEHLQRFFMEWFRGERTKSMLTFPVVTTALLNDEIEGGVRDEEFAEWLANEMARGADSFIYQSPLADSLASCCRLRNEIGKKPAFSYSLGAGGVMVGSGNVMTPNLNRFVQNCFADWYNMESPVAFETFLRRRLKKLVKAIHKFQHCYRLLLEDFQKQGMMPVYDAHFIALEKQFMTIGISGLVEAAEFLGIEPAPTTEYARFVELILKTIYEENRKATKRIGVKFNTEMVPGESLGVKFAKWDEEDDYFVPRPCYNSYFYRVEDVTLDVVDKFILHGKQFVKWLDGGSAMHLNLDEHLSKQGYFALIMAAAEFGTNYWTYNVPSTCCEDCGRIDPRNLEACPYCDSTNVSKATRVIGYLKKVNHFSENRQNEHGTRYYH